VREKGVKKEGGNEREEVEKRKKLERKNSKARKIWWISFLNMRKEKLVLPFGSAHSWNNHGKAIL
jgi:hypothetical protein